MYMYDREERINSLGSMSLFRAMQQWRMEIANIILHDRQLRV